MYPALFQKKANTELLLPILLPTLFKISLLFSLRFNPSITTNMLHHSGWQGCSLGFPLGFALGKSLGAALPALGKPHPSNLRLCLFLPLSQPSILHPPKLFPWSCHFQNCLVDLCSSFPSGGGKFLALQ